MRKTVEKYLTLRQTMIDRRVVDGRSVFVQQLIKKYVRRYRERRGLHSVGKSSSGDLRSTHQGPNRSASINLADNLKELGLEIGRFKTGTPPRVKAYNYQYDVTEIQPGDEAP